MATCFENVAVHSHLERLLLSSQDDGSGLEKTASNEKRQLKPAVNYNKLIAALPLATTSLFWRRVRAPVPNSYHA
ncbi:unnamed protein product [Phyllotreta striolata]|uniref:Uncharacterized protein n=1 Tax=Phyllotreta striolata TaxID=444603 RepID=A0A9N9XIX6_PHYSR|nr:unnamed protein product [Phyllotreta striolata]